MTKKNPNARPQVLMTPDLAADYCRHLSEGEPAAEWHRVDGHPCKRTIQLLRDRDKEFATAEQEARDEGFDKIAWGARDIADGKHRRADDAIAVQRDKLRVWARLQLLAKWDPKRYGDSTHLKIGGDGGNPIRVLRVVTGCDEEAE